MRSRSLLSWTTRVTPPQRVGVVTVTFNTGDTLESFLSSVTEASVAPVDVVVVDNASSDVAVARQIAESHGARFVALDGNVGYGAGVGSGFDALAADCDFVLISNPDVTLQPGAIDELLRAALEHPDAGAFGPLILTAEGDIYPSARKLPSLRTGVGHAMFGRVWPSNPWTRSYRAESTVIEARDAGWLSGACLLVRTDAFAAVGGFDKGYFMYFEDVDLGARLTEAGWKNRYVPTSIVTHTGAHSTSQHSHRMDRVHHASAYRYLSRKYSAWYLGPLRFALRVGLRTRSTWTTRKR